MFRWPVPHQLPLVRRVKFRRERSPRQPYAQAETNQITPNLWEINPGQKQSSAQHIGKRTDALQGPSPTQSGSVSGLVRSRTPIANFCRWSTCQLLALDPGHVHPGPAR